MQYSTSILVFLVQTFYFISEFDSFFSRLPRPLVLFLFNFLHYIKNTRVNELPSISSCQTNCLVNFNE